MDGRRLRGCFVTGTDTGVGKTVVAGAIVARLRALGVMVRAFKPLITGLDDPPDPNWPPDHELLARAAAAPVHEVALVGYGPPVSPHLAAELAGQAAPSPAELAGRMWATAGGAVTVVEGVGGLLVPLGPGPGADVRALAAAVGLPLVIAARPGLGTINHTLLTIEAARAAELDIAGVVLTPWPSHPSVMQRSNRETIERLGEVETRTLPLLASSAPEQLAAAGAHLPVQRWLETPASDRPRH